MHKHIFSYWDYRNGRKLQKWKLWSVSIIAQSLKKVWIIHELFAIKFFGVPKVGDKLASSNILVRVVTAILGNFRFFLIDETQASGSKSGLAAVVQTFCFCCVMKLYTRPHCQTWIQTKLSIRTWTIKQIQLVDSH